MSETPQEFARRARPFIEAVAELQSNTAASQTAWMYPRLKYDGALVAYKTRINWHGVTMMARTALYDTEQNDPEHAPNLWAAIRSKDGHRYIEVNMPAELGFDYLELGWWENELYESLMAGNIHTPASAPTAWRKV